MLLPSLLVFSSWVWLTHPNCARHHPWHFRSGRRASTEIGQLIPLPPFVSRGILGSLREVRACPLFQELLEFVHRHICIAQNTSEELGMQRHTGMKWNGDSFSFTVFVDLVTPTLPD